jgi:aldose 1-epimerase
MKRIISLALAFPLVAPGLASAASAERKAFGALPDRRALEAITLSNAKGMRAMILSEDALLQSLYTGDFLDGAAIGHSGPAYRQGDGIALEPQVFPDTPNQPAFGSA